MNVAAVIAFIGETVAVIGAIAPIIATVGKVANGTKCQLRSEMLRIYYNNHQSGKIRQYEYENFVKLYEAYKALKGNSFIDEIYDKIKDWEIIT